MHSWREAATAPAWRQPSGFEGRLLPYPDTAPSGNRLHSESAISESPFRPLFAR